MNLKTVFKLLSKLFDWLWHINLVMGIMALILVSLNAFTNNKTITASYLGKFNTKIEQVGTIKSQSANNNIYINEMTTTPSVLIDNNLNLLLTFGFILFILLIVLGYNYQLMKLFNDLNNINSSSIFIKSMIDRFTNLAKFSFLLFAIGLILSIIKFIIINHINIGNIIFKPAFDSQIINLAWLGVGFFIIAGIFNIGNQLQSENELTI